MPSTSASGSVLSWKASVALLRVNCVGPTVAVPGHTRDILRVHEFASRRTLLRGGALPTNRVSPDRYPPARVTKRIVQP